MKAPDKVYVKKEKDNVTFSLSVQYNNGGEEYIRKEALLEWTKANLQDRDNWNEKSAADAFWEVIDKLNEM